MRIRNQLFLNNILLGVIPLLLTFILLLAVITIQSENEIKNNLENIFKSFKSKIEKDTEYYRNYAYLYALNTRFTNNMLTIDTGKLNLNLSSYFIKTLEIMRSNVTFYQRSVNKEHIPYLTPSNIIENLWKEMNSPFYAPNFRLSYPDIVSNTLVVRNTAIIANENDEKIGIIIVGQPLTTEYLGELAFGNSDVVLFVETEGGIIFSREDMQKEKNGKSIKNLEFSENSPYHTVTLSDGSRFYVYKQFLYKIKDKAVANLGVLYGLESLSRTLGVVRIVSIVLFVLCLVIALILSYFFSQGIITPILSLQELVKGFKEESGAIPTPKMMDNEIAELQYSFSEMSRNIINYQNKLKMHTQELNHALSTIKQDLSLAQTIQRKMLPQPTTTYGNIHFSIKYIPMTEVGGDIYDIFEITPNIYRIFIADATGHGVQAALLTMIIKSEYEKLKTLISEPSELLEMLNSEFMTSYYSLAMFFTCIVMDLDIHKGVVKLCNAGHPRPILIDENGVAFLSTSSNMIGVLKGIRFHNESYTVKNPFKLLIYTDGLTEEFNLAGVEFGEKSLLSHIEQNKQKSMTNIIESILSSMKTHVGKNTINDDITIIGIDCASKK